MTYAAVVVSIIPGVVDFDIAVWGISAACCVDERYDDARRRNKGSMRRVPLENGLVPVLKCQVAVATDVLQDGPATGVALALRAPVPQQEDCAQPSVPAPRNKSVSPFVLYNRIVR